MLSPFLHSDIEPFISLATAEGWICGEWELEFLLESFPQGCLVEREGDCVLGYVTAIRHDRSGWIGNLLVAPGVRGRGIGRKLMEAALHALQACGVETVWLTASADGVGLYKKLGFVAIDSINRWVGEGSNEQRLSAAPPCDQAVMRHVDRSGWGDRRDALLAVTSRRGQAFCSNYSFICTQAWGHGTQLGPWGSLLTSEAEPLLDVALSCAGEQVFLDVPVGNVAAAGLLTRRGFSIRGYNTLMYLGAAPKYEPQRVFALASMGSMG